MGFSLINSYKTPQGNPSHVAWSDDGKLIVVANNETESMSAIKIDASTPASPIVAAQDATANFLWSVAQSTGLAVFRVSIGGQVICYNESDWSVRWNVHGIGGGHNIADDGTNAYVPVESTPGSLKVIRMTDGATLFTVTAPQEWFAIYAIAVDVTNKKLYIGTDTDPVSGSSGGIFIYDLSSLPGSAPTYLGRIVQPVACLAVSHNILYAGYGPTLFRWDVTNPASPVSLSGYTWPNVIIGTKTLQLGLGDLTVNAAGTRLYATYLYFNVATGQQDLSHQAGAVIIDVSVSPPSPINYSVAQAQFGFQGQSGLFYAKPFTAAIDPTGTYLAVSFWEIGATIYNVANDQPRFLNQVPTAGEAHDINVDAAGNLDVYNKHNVVILTPSGSITKFYNFYGEVDGGYVPFREGRFVTANSAPPVVIGFGNGTITYFDRITGGVYKGSGLQGVAWDGNVYLYSGDGRGNIFVQSVTHDALTDSYTLSVVSSLQLPGSGSGDVRSLWLDGSMLWAVVPERGVFAIDVSTPSSLVVRYSDTVTFPATNGGHVGIVKANGRIYVGAGETGIRIYDPINLVKTNTLTNWDANFLDTINVGATPYLIVSNYPLNVVTQRAGLYALNVNIPDAPVLYDSVQNGGPFRSRVIGGNVYEVNVNTVHVFSLT